MRIFMGLSFYSHPTGQNAIAWPPLTTRDAGGWAAGSPVKKIQLSLGCVLWSQ